MRSDRRPGTTDTRARILTTARQEFAIKGFRGATTRSIAGAAGVDVALLSHLLRRDQPKGSPPKPAYRTRQRVAELIDHHDRHGVSKCARTLSHNGPLIALT